MSRIPQWWIVGRARRESGAIRAFLRNHPDPRLEALLEVLEWIRPDSMTIIAGQSFERPWTNPSDESGSLGAMGNFGSPVLERESTHLSESASSSFTGATNQNLEGHRKP